MIRSALPAVVALAVFGSFACSRKDAEKKSGDDSPRRGDAATGRSESEDDDEPSEAPTSADAGGRPAPAPVQEAPGDDLISGEEPEPTPVQSMDAGACASENAQADLEPVILAFAFDVSGSMGQGDFPYHDKSLKWDPVVSATKAFFADPESRGLSASLTFFPIDAAPGVACEGSSYTDPVVPLTELPSEAFAEAIDEATPQSAEEWLGGTPTWAVLEGTREFLMQSMTEHPEARHAIVLVTDGEPSSCGEMRNDIGGVADFIASYRDEAPTYVIGVANPVTEEEPNPPDVVSNLHLLAESGGTSEAFIVDTGNAEETAAELAAVVASIRRNNLSCTMLIPRAPSGQELDTELVNVTYWSGDDEILLAYSEDCSAEQSWRFDDPDDPETIELCDDTCEDVRQDSTASLEVEFGCLRRTRPPGAR